MRATILTLLILAVPSLCAAGPTVGDLAWMAGSWRSEDGGGAVSEEIWSAPGGGIMLGMHRDVTAKRTSYEFIRIAETAEGIVYFASPSGRPATPFRLTELADQRAVFANPQHDFPKRIIYWRDDARLCARVEGDGIEGEEWCWERIADREF